MRGKREVIEHVDAFLIERESDLLELACDLVATNSQIPPHGDERAIADLLRDRLTGLGLEDIEEIETDRRRPNLLVRLPGARGGPNLMLNGHFDTKPVGDARPQWRTDPLTPTIEGGRLWGLGASDMKAAVAAMVYAAAALRGTGRQLAGDLYLGLVADEEAGAGYGSRVLAERLSGRVDACLVGEPSGWEHDWQRIHVASRGVCGFRIVVHGTQMHSSLSDRMPSISATTEMARLMLRLPEELRFPFAPHPLDRVSPTLNVGVIVEGGVYFGVVPGHASFGCDLRTVPGMTPEEVHTALTGWIDKVKAEGLAVELRYEPGLHWVPWAEIRTEHPLVAATTRAAEEVLGATPKLGVFPGATDAPWFERAGIPTLPSFGPGILTHCHGPNEFVSIASIPQAARMYSRIAVGYCGLAESDES